MSAGEGKVILTMVSVLLTSWKGLGLLRELPEPIGRRRDTVSSGTPSNRLQAKLLEFLTRRLPSQPTDLLNELSDPRLAGEGHSALSGFGDAPLIVRIPADSDSVPAAFSHQP